VLYAGQLEKQKGVMTLLEAARNMPGIRLDIAGDGQLRGEVESTIADPAWSGAEVHVHGRVGPDVLNGLIAAARVVVVPSEWYENSPYAVIEAFAHARPVVATRIGGLPELVVDGVSGITVDAHSPDQIASAIAHLMDDPVLWARCAEGALRTATSRDATAYTGTLERLYSDLRRDGAL
jgi:glycosyltransferase involved in cell wall biosynthesis